jgi:hypothetical protein
VLPDRRDWLGVGLGVRVVQDAIGCATVSASSRPAGRAEMCATPGMLAWMPRATAAAAKLQARALRVLANEIESGRRRPSPELRRVLAKEIEAPSEEDLSAEEWAKAWGAEIDRRLAGRSKRRDLGSVLERLRAER